MKKRGPIVAPGWMSIPVREWARSDQRRGRIGTSFRYSSCASRAVAIASTQG
jgi:hypothetical protein